MQGTTIQSNDNEKHERQVDRLTNNSRESNNSANKSDNGVHLYQRSSLSTSASLPNPDEQNNCPLRREPEAAITLDVTSATDHQYTGHHEHYYHHDSALGRRRSTTAHDSLKQSDSETGATSIAQCHCTVTHTDDDGKISSSIKHTSGENLINRGCLNMHKDIEGSNDHDITHDTSHRTLGHNVTGDTSYSDNSNLSRKNTVSFRSGGRVYHHARSNSTNSRRSFTSPLVQSDVHQDTVIRSLNITGDQSQRKHSTSTHLPSTLHVHSCLRKSVSSTSQLTTNQVVTSAVKGTHSTNANAYLSQCDLSTKQKSPNIQSIHESLSSRYIDRRPSENYLLQVAQRPSTFDDGGDCFDDDDNVNDVDIGDEETLNPLVDNKIDGVNESDNQIDVHCVDDKLCQHNHHHQHTRTGHRRHSRPHHHHHHYHQQQQQYHQHQHRSRDHQRTDEQQLHSALASAVSVNVIDIASPRTLINNKIKSTDSCEINASHRKVSVGRSSSFPYQNTHLPCSSGDGDTRDVLTYTKFFMLAAFLIFICGSGITVHELIDFLTESQSTGANKYISGVILLSIGLISLFGLYGSLKEDSFILLIYGVLILIVFIAHVILLFTLKKLCLDKARKCYNNIATPPGIAPIIVTMSELAISLSSIFMSIVIESSKRKQVKPVRDYKIYFTSSSNSSSRRDTITNVNDDGYATVSHADDSDTRQLNLKSVAVKLEEENLVGTFNRANESRRKQLTSTSSSSSQGGKS